MGYLLLGSAIAVTAFGGVNCYNYERKLDRYGEELAPITAKIEQIKNERSTVESQLESCLASSENQNGCLGLSFHYNKLNNEYHDLYKKSRELTTSIDSASRKSTLYMIMSSFVLASSGLCVAKLIGDQRRRSKRTTEKLNLGRREAFLKAMKDKP